MVNHTDHTTLTMGYKIKNPYCGLAKKTHHLSFVTWFKGQTKTYSQEMSLNSTINHAVSGEEKKSNSNT